MSISCYTLKMTPTMAVRWTTGTSTTSRWDVLCCRSDIHCQNVDEKTLSDRLNSCVTEFGNSI